MEKAPRLSIKFHPDGYIMYVRDLDHNMKHTYTLDKAFDITTAQYIGTITDVAERAKKSIAAMLISEKING